MLDIQCLHGFARNFGRVQFREKRSGLFKILVPFFYEDGDMYDMFVEESPKNSSLLRISDYGLTLMKLSYNFDIDTPKKREVLENTIMQNRCLFSDGMIYLDISPQQFEMGIYQFAQVISKVNAMDMLSYDTIQSLFYEHLDKYVVEKLSDYDYFRNYLPSSDSQLVVDYKVSAKVGNAKPIFLFGVNENTKASKVVITCLSFQKQRIPFRSLIVHENIDNLSSFNRNQIMNAADKQFASIDDFCVDGLDYIERELAS